MTNRSTPDPETYPETYQQEALGNDPSVTREAFDEVSERLDNSQSASEQAKKSNQAAPSEQSLPADVEAEIAAVAKDVDDLTMGIEDGA